MGDVKCFVAEWIEELGKDESELMAEIIRNMQSGKSSKALSGPAFCHYR